MYLIEGKEGKGVRLFRPKLYIDMPFQVASIDWRIYQKRLPGSFLVDAMVMLLASLSLWIGNGSITLSVALIAAQFAHLTWKASWAASPLKITIDDSSRVLPVPLMVSGEHCIFLASIGFLIAIIDKQANLIDPRLLAVLVGAITVAGVIPLLSGFAHEIRRSDRH